MKYLPQEYAYISLGPKVPFVIGASEGYCRLLDAVIDTCISDNWSDATLVGHRFQGNDNPNHITMVSAGIVSFTYKD